MKLTDKVVPFSVYNDLKEQAVFQRYARALGLPDTPEHFAWWRQNRSHNKSLWEWNADAPFPSTDFNHDWNSE